MKKKFDLWVFTLPTLKKLIMEIKIVFLIILVSVSNVFATPTYSQVAKVSLDMENKSLEQVMDEIELQTEFYFIFNQKQIDVSRIVNIQVKNKLISDILPDLFNGTNVNYAVLDKKILLTTDPLGNDLLAISLNTEPQQKIVTGIVTQKDGTPLPGVNIVVTGTTQGTITDINGKYNIEVPQGSKSLTFSFIGMNSQEVIIGTLTQINITLTESAFGLEEVIVVGYGTQIKRNITGSIQTLKTDDLVGLPTAQVAQTLQGKLTGVQINQGTGIPGKPLQVRIRNAGSISAESSPLYVIDGFPISGELIDFNPEEIESISVMKDAASTSLYGSRASNGVVLITTKRATTGKTEIKFNAYSGLQVLPEKGRPDLMNGTEFAQYKKESYEDKGLPVPEAFQNPAQYGEGYNWYDIMFRQASIQDYSVSLSSGTNKYGVSAVAGYFNQEGILINSGYSRYTLRINSDFKINDWLSIGFNLAPNYSTSFTPQSDGIFWQNGLLCNAMQTWPILPYINDDGTLPLTAWLPGLGGFPASNYYRAAQEIKTTTKTGRLLSNAFISIEPIKDLVLKSTINIEYGTFNSKFWNPSTSSTRFGKAPPITSRAEYKSLTNLNWLSENTAVYRKTFGGHNFEALAGYTVQKYTNNSMGIVATNFPDDRINDVDSAPIIQMAGTDTDAQEWSLISYIGRLNYDFKGKYLLSASMRRDGSSRFGEDNKWGNFPSVSLGWIASEESFFPKNKVVTFMKVRASYGLTGNNNIGNYSSYASVNLGYNHIFGSTVAPGSYVASLSNPLLGWEKNSQFNIGADMGFLNNRISLIYDFYSKRTTDMLYNFRIPASSGFDSFLGNSGELKFWGHEISIVSDNMVGKFRWTSTVNFSFGDTKVISLAPGIDVLYSDVNGFYHISKVGQRIGLFYGLVRDGVYDNQEEYDNSAKAVDSGVGTCKFKDLNNDGVILNELTGGDMTVIGDPTPKFLFGIINTFNYKNFDLSVVTSGSVGNDILNEWELGTMNLDGPFNVLKDVKYRWRSPANPGLGKYGTTTYAAYQETDFCNDRYIHDGSFLTIKNITLGYNINVNKIKFMSRLRVYASLQQVYTFTKYDGNNPEVSFNSNVLILGQDQSSYPVPRTFTFGINMEF
jgi:TonB-linked SusC/RagA family outer membrane protein